MQSPKVNLGEKNMPEVGLGEFDNTEELKKAVEAFEKVKKGIQDHILERTGVVPDNTIREIEKKFNLPQELAKAVFVLEFEYLIPREISANFFIYEIRRLEEAQYELPDIYSFRVRFSMEEGFWIKYLVVDLPKKLKLKLGKLAKFNQSLFGDLAGDKEDAALYIIERAYICSDIIRPIMQSWMDDHHRVTYTDCAASFICSIQQKAREKGSISVKQVGERFSAEIDTIHGIIAKIKPQGWILKAKEEYNNIADKLNSYHANSDVLDWRLAAEIILESMLLTEHPAVLSIPETPSFQKPTTISTITNVTKTISSQKSNFMIDKISKVLVQIENQSKERKTKIIRELVEEEYNTATIKNREKPAIFSRKFLENLMSELGLPENKTKKIIKKFDVKLMYRLSPTGGKEFPNLSMDEKITNLIEEFFLDILVQSEEVRSNEKIKPTAPEEKDTTQKKEEIIEKRNEIEMSNISKLKDSTEKELWLYIRDEYLKELFDSDKETIAGARVLKKHALELGLLMTEGEANSYLITELEKKGLLLDEMSSEELDTNICKIIYSQLKDLRRK